MNNFYKKIIFGIVVGSSTFGSVFSAQIFVTAPEHALANRQPIVVQVFLDTQGDMVSGLSASLSFPSDMFYVENINTEGSVVSLWGEQPKVSDEKYFDNRTRITFEGIFPGGYDGVRSPYYQGKKPGILFTLLLTPKNEGVGSFVVDDVKLHSFDSEATLIKVADAIKPIIVPALLPLTGTSPGAMRRVKSQTLQTFITRDALVENNSWYLIVHEREGKSAIQKILVAETDDYNAELVADTKWREVKNPYVLLYQNRSKYVHVKVIYANNTYTTQTLPPVENSKSISSISRILVSIIVVLLLLYLYGKYPQTFFKKEYESTP